MPLKLTPAFEQWFKGSKVVDASGKPLVVYHGTGGIQSGFSKFQESSEGFFGSGGIYFTNSPEFADEYANNYDDHQNLMPVYVRILNPYLATGEENEGMTVTRAKFLGYDSIIYKSDNASEDIYVAFCPTQIKSDIGNSGDFDAASPDIRFSMADVNEVEDEAENSTGAPCP